MVHVVDPVVFRRWEIRIEPSSGHMIPFLWRDAWRAGVEGGMPTRRGERRHDLIVRRGATVI